MSSFESIDIEKAKKVAELKGLKPGRVKGTDAIQLTKGENHRFEYITWKEFEDKLNEKGLAIYEYAGWMKIMKKGKN
ncbi:hypothetical protein [Candidatus Methanarcanum hacksteinii]|uniref:hypothetical protein n=1 Tax=Candidatus Methanarcanum hacksteinii TaxID=2911857 RepID=UPI0037DC4D4C